ncbi:MAG: hypothetical protein JJU09_10760 [Rhodobacteraceae bacterium]|nr:hypothetical protein [Paracoccaceae bacterium]
MPDMDQLFSFARLKDILDLRGYDKGYEDVAVNRDGLTRLIQHYVARFPLDEEWYRAVNPDVDAAIQSGGIATATEHFISQGYLEGRAYCPADFDETAYLELNPDLRAAREDGNIPDLRVHFVRSGYAEGRRYK